MQRIVTVRRGPPLRPVLSLLPPGILTLCLWATAGNPITPLQVFLAFLLLCPPWISFRRWRQRPAQQIPLFAVISGVYWIYFGLALFWGNIEYSAYYPLGSAESDKTITLVLLMALIGMLMVRCGMALVSRMWSPPPPALEFVGGPASWNYLSAVLILSLVLSQRQGSGGDARQIVMLLLDFVPIVAFVLLLQKYLEGGASGFEKLLILGFLGLKGFLGLASGWLGSVAALVVVVTILYLKVRRKLPVIAFVLLAFYILFFQVSKEQFREKYWYHQNSANYVERLLDWTSLSMQMWGQFLDRPSAQTLRGLAGSSLNRLSLLSQAARVVERTPSIVPYQYGKLYRYMAITLIPRVIWPEKPSFNEANQFYQVAYGLTTEKELTGVSISVGILVESYISLGWAGVLLIMFLLGIFYGAFERFFLARDSTSMRFAIGIAMIPAFVAVESQFAQYLGGVVQHIGLAYVAFLPALHKIRPVNQRVMMPTGAYSALPR